VITSMAGTSAMSRVSCAPVGVGEGLGVWGSTLVACQIDRLFPPPAPTWSG
jgi:hypothetical protein